MTNTTLFNHAPDVSAEDYCVFGLATCFIRGEGEVTQVQVVEPIPSSALEAILKGVPTSYQFAVSKQIGDLISKEKLSLPAEFPPETQFSENFVERTVAASRTYKNRTEAMKHLPLGTVYKEFNYSLERKRILNSDNIVTAEDNVKQHAYTHQVL